MSLGSRCRLKHRILSDTPDAQVLLPLRARSRASALLQIAGVPRDCVMTRLRVPCAMRHAETACRNAISVGARLPAIGCAAVVKPDHLALPDTPHARVLLPLRARSRASALLQMAGVPRDCVKTRLRLPCAMPRQRAVRDQCRSALARDRLRSSRKTRPLGSA